MNRLRRLILFASLPWAAFASAQLSAADKITPEQAEFFEKKIRPVLAENCWKCHGPDKHEGNLRLDRYARVLKGGDTGPAVVPGKPDDSEIVDAIGYDPTGYQMPPDGKLPQETIGNIIAWIRMGAPWPGGDKETDAAAKSHFDLAARAKHWSYQPIEPHVPPAVKNAAWVRTPVDAFILEKLEAAGLAPAKPADKRTLLRRIYLDLTGLPPTPAEIAGFLNDDSPNAYDKVVDRLLASPAYGERWARHWLDLVRYAETAGHEFDYEIPYAWRYRDYVIRAFNEDLPYDRLIVEHLAGDLLPHPRRRIGTGLNESILGTSFYWLSQGKHSPVDVRAEECDLVDNQLDVIGRAFLGTSIACARCHDHKFDAIRTTDYYSLAGFLQSSRRNLAQIDPPEKTTRLAARIVDLNAKRGPSLARIAAAAYTAAADHFAAKLQHASDGWPAYLSDVAAKDEHNPLHLWSQLGQISDPNQFLQRKNQLKQRWNARKQAALEGKDSVVFEDFSSPPSPRWFPSGPAWQHPYVAGGEFELGDKPEQPVRRLWEPATANSGLAGAKWQGYLRSPTFTIEHKTIWYRAKRIGGKPNPGRKHKNGQIHLIVDGFQLIQNPLYGMLSQNVPNDGRWHWIGQDTTKFPGHNAYIELEDSDDGTIIVDRILFSNAGRPPEPPDALQLAILNDPQIDSPEKLAAAYQKNLLSALKSWTRATLAADHDSRGEVALLNVLLESQLIPAQPKLSDEDRALAAETINAQQQLEKQIGEPTYATTITDGTPENEHVLIRGQPSKPGDEVPRRFLEVFETSASSLSKSSSGRLELAERFVRDNPLAARVIVNRLWHHHFGKGLVTTVDDFGHMGRPPTHPELLDYLATEFIRRGWSLKSIHRLIVLSNTYRMSSDLGDADPAAEKADPQNALVHRMNLVRLEAEVIRDEMLALSGRLDTRLYGESVMPFLTPFMEGRGRPGRSGPLDGDGRRSIYINVRRNFLPPMFLAFDYPIPFTTMGRRSVSNVPAQGLSLMNNDFVAQQARMWSNRVLAETAGETDPARLREARIRRLYEQAFARTPALAEITAAANFLEAQGQEYTGPNDPKTWADLCHVLMNVKEFVYVR